MARNLKDRGFSSSFSGGAGSGYKGVSSNGVLRSAGTGLNLTQRGYPSSIGDGSAGLAGLGANGGTGSSKGSGTAFGRLMASRKSSGGNGGAWDALLAAYQGNGAQSYYDQMKAMAQNAYNEGMAALEAAYGDYMGALSSNLDSTKGQLLDSYNRSKTSINEDAARSLKQAYINKMKSERNLDQQMSAQGLSGGATETTRASMANNYGNARNEINTTTNDNLSALEGEYNDNVAQALQAYNSAVANAQLQKAQQAIQLRNALANNEIAALQDYQSLMQDDQAQYMDLLQNAIEHGANFNFNPTSANNAVQALEFYQTPMGGDNRTQNNLMQALQAIMGQSNQPMQVNPAQNNYLAQILAQLRR